MSTITQMKAQRYKEAQMKKHGQDIKKLRSGHHNTYTKELKKNRVTLSQLKDNHETKVDNLKIELEQKFTSIRNKQKLAIQSENRRLNEEVENIKTTHSDQVGEIKMSQANDLERLKESHEKTLSNARQKLIQEKARLDIA